MAAEAAFSTPFRLTSQIAEADRATTNAQKPTQTAVEARATADSFEAHFLATFVDSMFSGMKTDGPFGGGHGETVFRSLLNQEYAGAMTRSGGVGIADSVFNEILKIQESSQ
jgi:peptidoglycan hydrolase FlgJ